MFRRAREVAESVEVVFDKKKVPARVGEPLLVGMLATGASAISRSPKLHRPRGPFCLRGDCDGCLARVDDVPNVMTCQRVTRGGERIEAQNVVGTRSFDLLRITDWFFPQGIDHHHLLAGVPGASDVMQAFARRMAGMGRLPREVAPARPAKRRDVDVLVVGAGLAGLTVAAMLSRRFDTLVIDEGHDLGGAARIAGGAARRAVEAIDVGALDVAGRTTVMGFFDGDALASAADGATIVRPRRVVVATGAHDVAPLVPNNELPGVISARAFAALAHHGLAPTVPVVVVGDGPWADVAVGLAPAGTRRVREADLEAVEGTSKVRAVRTRQGGSIVCGIVVTALPPAPSFELGVQRGLATRPATHGFALDDGVDDDASRTTWAAGECAGVAFEPDAIVRHATGVANAVAASLG